MPDPLDTLGLPPLDLGESMTMGSPPPQSAPNSKATAKQYAPLLALLPIAMAKGGQAGVAALLQGYQQARQQKAATTRQTGIDTEAQRRVNEQERLRREQLSATTASNEALRRQQLMQTFQGGLENLDSPEAVQAYMALMGPQAQAVGLRPETLDAFAQQAVTPSRMQKKEATRVLEEAKKQYGDTASAHTYVLKDGTKADWATLNQRAGVMLGSQGQTSGDDLRKSSIDVQAADALARGDMESYARLKRVADEMSGARRVDPPAAGAPNPRMDARVDRIVTSFNSHPLVKEYNEVQAQQGIIQRVVNSPWSGPGDMAAVFAFMKALDPTSVVRETEYDNAARSGNIFQGWAARFNGALNPNGGFLSDRVRRDFLRTIDSRLAIKTSQYQNLRGQLVSRVNRIKAGAPETGDEALIDYSTGAAPVEPPAGSGGWTETGDGTRVRVKRP
jgi:hypothetical protein